MTGNCNSKYLDAYSVSYYDDCKKKMLCRRVRPNCTIFCPWPGRGKEGAISGLLSDCSSLDDGTCMCMKNLSMT